MLVTKEPNVHLVALPLHHLGRPVTKALHPGPHQLMIRTLITDKHCFIHSQITQKSAGMSVCLCLHKGNRTSCLVVHSRDRSSVCTTLTRSAGTNKLLHNSLFIKGTKSCLNKLKIPTVCSVWPRGMCRCKEVSQFPSDRCWLLTENVESVKLTLELCHKSHWWLWYRPPCRMAVLWTISWASALNSSKLLYFPSEMFCRGTEDAWERAEADGTCFY